jgi:hypothetical protein
MPRTIADTRKWGGGMREACQQQYRLKELWQRHRTAQGLGKNKPLRLALPVILPKRHTKVAPLYLGNFTDMGKDCKGFGIARVPTPEPRIEIAGLGTIPFGSGIASPTRTHAGS